MDLAAFSAATWGKLMRIALTIALAIFCSIVAACSNSEKDVQKDLHPSLNLFANHYALPQKTSWQGDLNKSIYGDDYIGQANFQLSAIFPNSNFVITRLPGSETAIGTIDGNWKENGNRLIARLPRPWWKLSPPLGESTAPPPDESVDNAETKNLAERDEFGFFLLTKSPNPSEISTLFFILMAPQEGNSSRTQVLVQSRTFVAFPKSLEDIEASSDRQERLELIARGLDENACYSEQDAINRDESGKLVDKDGNPVYYNINSYDYTIGAKLIDGKIIGGRRVPYGLPNCVK
jgi:hypothetical protein